MIKKFTVEEARKEYRQHNDWPLDSRKIIMDLCNEIDRLHRVNDSLREEIDGMRAAFNA